MLFKNANIFTAERGFIHGGFRVEDGVFAEVTEQPEGEGIDLGGAYVLPGLVDVHSHGNSGADFSDGDYEGTAAMGCYLARNGITSFAPASMTLPYETLEKAFAVGARISENRPEGCARLLGIHMEGPYFSEKKKGAQNGAYLRLPDFEGFAKLYNGCGGLVKIVDVAAELDGAANFAEKASKLCTVSVAHTDASYEEAKAVFTAGATHLTHLFNAMPPIHHRKPGVIGAASEGDVIAELICDGLHVHESVVRMAFRLFPGRICLISDALRCCGMPDGEYELGGQQVYLENNVARLSDGTIAGSASNLFQCMKNAIAFGIDRDEAIRAASVIPAGEIGAADKVGSIAAGHYADFLVCSEKLELQRVYIGGQPLAEL